ncbi:PQQ-like beta-propeller repeat protein [candidate division KSB1 bacterium]|nr:PQQ-like beta-propeller repeat protein [candidate division KSB1 bacterium]
MLKIKILLLFLISTNMVFAQTKLTEFEKNWTQWRGPTGNGIALQGNPPLEWSETKNIKWKTEIPGKGHSSPIIWGDQIFLTTAITTDKKGEVKEEAETPQRERRGPPSVGTDKIHQFVVLSVNRQTGQIQWQRIVREEVPHDRTHEFGSWASNSCTTDGKNLYAYFGSRGLYCLDFKGNLKWERDFGKMNKVMSFGEGSSPTLYEDKLILIRDHEGPSAIYVLDKKTGKDIWKADRDEISSWATPRVVIVSGKPQIITSATKKIRSYDLNSGEIIWEATGLTRNVIPYPVIAGNIVYLMSGFRGSALLAIDFTRAKGDISNSDAIVWKYGQDTPYTPSPVILGDKLYFMKVNNGSLSCLDLKDGKVNYSSEKIEGIPDLFTSPVAVKDRIYVTGRKGLTAVIKAGDQFEVLASNQLDDNFIASMAIINDAIYLRGYQYLYCISEK